jgi:hypothetical protein
MANKSILGEDEVPSLYTQGFRLMMRGAGYGAIIFFGGVFFIFVLVAIGSLLPPESKEAPDPSLGAIEAPAEIRAA